MGETNGWDETALAEDTEANAAVLWVSFIASVVLHPTSQREVVPISSLLE